MEQWTGNAKKDTDLSYGWVNLTDRGETPPSWDLAKRLIASGVSGINVPSFAPVTRIDMHNVVFWNWDDKPPHQVFVIDDLGRLSRNRASWKNPRPHAK